MDGGLLGAREGGGRGRTEDFIYDVQIASGQHGLQKRRKSFNQ